MIWQLMITLRHRELHMDLKEWIQQKKILRSQLNVQEPYNAKKQFQIEEILFLN